MMIKKIKHFLKEIWLGIKIANRNYLNGKSQGGKFQTMAMMIKKNKRLTREEKKEKAIKDLINKMFEIAGHSVTYDDILGVENWFQKYTMTLAQSEEFKKWGKKYLMKELRMYAKSAEREMMWFNLQWGLTYSDYPL